MDNYDFMLCLAQKYKLNVYELDITVNAFIIQRNIIVNKNLSRQSKSEALYHELMHYKTSNHADISN